MFAQITHALAVSAARERHIFRRAEFHALYVFCSQRDVVWPVVCAATSAPRFKHRYAPEVAIGPRSKKVERIELAPVAEQVNKYNSRYYQNQHSEDQIPLLH
jgi:hypothetical protein